MSSLPTRRRLAAILAADIAGFSRLMGEGEDRTLASLKERRALTDASIAAHNGRIFHTAGDSVIAEFASPVDAISAAVQFQKAIGALNSASAESDRMQFRVELNLGDVMVEGDNLYGDGVNVAARIEATCVPGGITVSAKFYEEVRRKLALSFEPLGKQELKNIDEPVFTYRVNIDALLGASIRCDAVPAASEVKPFAAPEATRLVEKPSILVLPFENMSGLPDQEFFADGLTEDILTELSRFPELFVISRNTSFKYKGRAVDLKDIGRDLNVKYVLEGSVRKAGNRVRITV
jgi:adenylate cyclase